MCLGLGHPLHEVTGESKRDNVTVNSRINEQPPVT